MKDGALLSVPCGAYSLFAFHQSGADAIGVSAVVVVVTAVGVDVPGVVGVVGVRGTEPPVGGRCGPYPNTKAADRLVSLFPGLKLPDSLLYQAHLPVVLCGLGFLSELPCPAAVVLAP